LKNRNFRDRVREREKKKDLHILKQHFVLFFSISLFAQWIVRSIDEFRVFFETVETLRKISKLNEEIRQIRFFLPFSFN